MGPPRRLRPARSSSTPTTRLVGRRGLVLLARRLLPGLRGLRADRRRDAEEYGFFERIGVFGVEPDSPRGAAAFLRAATEMLSRPDRLLLITAQGRFTDLRERPLGLRPGVARLAEVAPDARFLPLAVEYAFWTERGAEALAAFGPRCPPPTSSPCRDASASPGSRRR